MFINFRDTRLKEIVLSQAEKQKQSFTDVLQNRCSQENTCFGVSFLKSCRLKACNFFKTRLQHRCFPVKFAKFLRAPFFTEHLRWLLLERNCVVLWQDYESAKLRALRAHVPTCLACLRSNVPCVLTSSRAYVPCMLTCSRAYVPCVLTCSRAYMPYVLTCSRANVPCLLTCSRASVPCVLTWSRAYVPCVLTFSRTKVSCVLMCSRDHVLTCQHALPALRAYVLTLYNYEWQKSFQ